MANWREKIELNKAISVVNDKFDLSKVEKKMPKEAKAILIAEVEKSVWLSGFVDDIREARSIAEVNRILEQVFNAADRHLVWCGFA